MDVVDRPTRSRMMAGIGGRNTVPEMTVRRALHAAGLRYRLHRRDLPGRPDIVLPRYQAAVFVHGCFWHRHRGCKYATTPSTRPKFWSRKFEENITRDLRQLRKLRRNGWRTFVIWECEARKPKALARLVTRIRHRAGSEQPRAKSS